MRSLPLLRMVVDAVEPGWFPLPTGKVWWKTRVDPAILPSLPPRLQALSARLTRRQPQAKSALLPGESCLL